MNTFFRAFLLVSLLFGSATSHASNSILKQALEDELERSMNELALEDVVKPYFIAYTVHVDHSTSALATHGGLQSANESRTRQLQVEMRVGTPELDNTNFMSRQGRNLNIRGTLPLEDDYALLRKQIWLTTDRAYKNAASVYAAKEAALQNSEMEITRDFSEEEPNVYVDKRKSQKVKPRELQRTVRELAALTKLDDEIQSHNIFAFANQHTDIYLNSEGSYFTRVDDTAFLRATASTQASDGRYITDFVNIAGRSWKDVSNLKEAKRKITEMNDRLKALRVAKTLNRYVGPVLFQGQAAAELIAQVVAPNLLNIKRPVFENTGFASAFSRSVAQNTFRERVGARVLPRGWSIFDDPTLETYQDEKLIGHYPVDSDGMSTYRVQLVERGVLKTLLSDRNPSLNVDHSTASNATSAGPSVSNLIIEPSNGLSDAELRQLMLDIVDEQQSEFGLRIDYASTPLIQAPDTPSAYYQGGIGQVIPAISAYKVFPDGTEELVRNVVISTSLSDLKNLPGYSDTTSVHHGNHTFQSGDVSKLNDRFTVFVSIATPDILLEDASIAFLDTRVTSQPIVPHPQAD